MVGRTADFTNPASIHTTKCACCGRKFIFHPSTHVYKRIGFGKRKDFCSYSCMKKWDRAQQTRDRTKERSAVNEMTYKYERKTLEEWADEAGVDYVSLWQLNVLSKIPISEAIYMLRIEKQYDGLQEKIRK